MSAEKNQMKQEIQAAAAAHKQEFEKVSAYIFANPELAFTEVKGQYTIQESQERTLPSWQNMMHCRRLVTDVVTTLSVPALPVQA